MLAKAISVGASDVHLKHGVVPVVRKLGALHPLDPQLKRISAEQIKDIAYSILSENQIAVLEAGREVDLGYGVQGLGRFRVNIFKQRGSIRIVIRAIPDRVPSIEELHLPQVIEKICAFERGLVLVTGVTGSGKSTTMASMVDYINANETRHIITIEDPIEYLLRDRRSLITQRELGSDTESFAKALRAALRQDPDVILIGEMRDQETIETALLAAETGHLVISTLHTADAPETINRILAVYESHKQPQIRIQLAATIKAIISQRLARRSDKKGVIPAVEVMISTARTREMIENPLKTKELTLAMEEGFQTYGMQTFDQSLMQLVSKNFVSYEEALQLSSNPPDFELRYKGFVNSGEGAKWEDFEDTKGSKWAEIPSVELQQEPENKASGIEIEINTRGHSQNVPIPKELLPNFKKRAK